MYKLAIFDFDGTLVDSLQGIVDVMTQVCAEYHLADRVINEFRSLVGVPLMRQMEIIFPDKNEEYWLELATRYRAIYDAKIIEICPLFPGLDDILKQLRKAQVKISIATSKRRSLVETVLEYHHLSHYFDLIIGNYDVINHKPHPESVYKTLDALSVYPADAVVIGDSTYDLDMARSAGVDAIGVTTGVHTEEILARSEPLKICCSLKEVLPIILDGRPESLPNSAA